MKEILEWQVTAEDPRQHGKVKDMMKDIIAIVFFAGLANTSEWIEMYLFAQAKSRNCLGNTWSCLRGYHPMTQYSGCFR